MVMPTRSSVRWTAWPSVREPRTVLPSTANPVSRSGSSTGSVARRASHAPTASSTVSVRPRQQASEGGGVRGGPAEPQLLVHLRRRVSRETGDLSRRPRAPEHRDQAQPQR